MLSTLSTKLSGSAAMGRRLAAGLFASLAVAGLSAGVAQAQSNDPTFELINQSGRTIGEAYVSHRSNPNWGRDVLGLSVLPSGSSILVNHLRRNSCTNDIRVVFTDGTAREMREVNTCRLLQVVVGLSGRMTPVAW